MQLLLRHIERNFKSAFSLEMESKYEFSTPPMGRGRLYRQKTIGTALKLTFYRIKS